MKTNILIFVIFCLTISTCESAKSVSDNTVTLEGTWQLNYITGPRIAFDGLYPKMKPTINFNLKENKVSGNNSCNQYFGSLLLDGNQINFKDAKMGMTKMACPGLGESTFMKTLEKIDSYSISEDGKTLNFSMGTIVMMRFEKVVKDSHNSKTALDWSGIYKGITPCADCEGIETLIRLNKDMTFVIQTKYLGKGDGKVFEDKGTFVWDKKGESISLSGLKERPWQYKVGENKLIQLDMQGKQISGSLAENYILTKEL